MSIDIKVFNQRAREIQRLVRRASPALVYSGPLGIAIAAPLRPGTNWRAGKVLDRMAFIGRGDTGARVLAHKIASAEARSIAGRFSQGDVKGHEPALAIGRALQESNHRYTLGAPLPVEACFVQLNATPETDYLAYISVQGTVRAFHKAWFLGESASETASATEREEAANQLNDSLTNTLGDYERFSDLWEALDRLDLQEPVKALRSSPRLDIVILDRKALERHEYEKVFQRLAL